MADPETTDKTEILIIEVAKNPILFDKAEKAYKETVKQKIFGREWEKKLDCQLCDLYSCVYQYRAISSWVFDFACAVIPIIMMTKFKLSQQEKDDPHRKPSTVFCVRVRALFECLNC